MERTVNHSIVPVHLVVKAMRDNGYKNAAYALAELMDNSIQAGATDVELLCAEETVAVEVRDRRRIAKVAVLDNACGMDAATLRMALQFGNGTRLDPERQDGIGRFGMGLPASSISQCKRVEVWSWQNGPDMAIHTYLDLDDIVEQRMTEVPEPQRYSIPPVWRHAGKKWGKSGTLVVWSNLDRIMWRTALAIIENSEFIIGRMYRRFIDSGQVRIRMAAFDQNRPTNTTRDIYARSNDPLYLMKGTSTPEPYDTQSMFEAFSDIPTKTHRIQHGGKAHEVQITATVAKKSAREGHNPGARDPGKHAAKNTGLSVVRAGRELELDDAWASTSDPRDRWWGLEVEFPPALDEIFGVTNNKQHAHNLAWFASFDFDDTKRSIHELKAEWVDVADPRVPLLEIALDLQKIRNQMRRLIASQTKQDERAERTRHDSNPVERRGTEATQRRQHEGYKGRSDAGESLPAEERKAEIEDELERSGIQPAIAEDIAVRTVDRGYKYAFADAELETSGFFGVSTKGGSIIITLNTDHPAYHSLVEVLEGDASNDSEAQLRNRLNKASEGLKLLLMAWARYEDEQPDGNPRQRARTVREDWGRVARGFLEGDDE
jgi:hypothetical protein